MNLSVVTPPASEPVDLVEAKAWLRLEVPDDDETVLGLISAARALCEKETRRCFLTTRLKLELSSVVRDARNAWPAPMPLYAFDDGLVLPRPPLRSVVSVSYWSGGVQATWDPANYHVVAGTPGRIRPASGVTWPACDWRDDALTITYDAGHGDAIADVDPDIAATMRLAIKVAVATWYESREAVLEGAAVELPWGLRAMLSTLDHGGYC
jgi:uncharacterized phiE125 gp8 family phage protein